MFGRLPQDGGRPQLVSVQQPQQVPGHLGRRSALRVQQSGGVPVQVGQDGRGRGVVDRLQRLGVADAVAVDHPAQVQRVQGHVDGLRAQVQQPAEQRRCAALAEHGDGPGHGEALGAAAVQAVEQCLVVGLGPDDLQGGALGFGGGPVVRRQRAQQQRVAAGDLVEFAAEPGDGGWGQLTGHQLLGAGAGEQLEPDAAEVGLLGEFGAVAGRAVPAPGRVREHHQHPLVADAAGHVQQELQGLLVAVVDVVDGDDQEAVTGGSQQRHGQLGDRLRHRGRLQGRGLRPQQPVRLGARGGRQRRMGHEAPEDPEGDAVLAAGGRRVQPQGPVGHRLVGELGQQDGLAASHGAGDQDDPAGGLPRVGERPPEFRHLFVAVSEIDRLQLCLLPRELPARHSGRTAHAPLVGAEHRRDGRLSLPVPFDGSPPVRTRGADGPPAR